MRWHKWQIRFLVAGSEDKRPTVFVGEVFGRSEGKYCRWRGRTTQCQLDSLFYISISGHCIERRKENTKEMRRKILSVTLKKHSMTTGFPLLHLNLGPHYGMQFNKVKVDEKSQNIILSFHILCSTLHQSMPRATIKFTTDWKDQDNCRRTRG